VKKTQKGVITAFKVIGFGTNRKPVCDFRLVINWLYLVPFPSYRSSLFKFQISDTLRFRGTLRGAGGGLREYDVHLGLTGKRV